MILFIYALVLLSVTLVTLVIRKSYSYIPATELKRRAVAGDSSSQRLYQAVAYGPVLDLFLWVLTTTSAASGFILLSRVAPVWLSFVAVGLLLWVFYELIPSSRLTEGGKRLTLLATPLIARCLNLLYPVFVRVVPLIERRFNAAVHTGLYERTDLLALIEQQLTQDDSRFRAEELMIAAQALRFHDYSVQDSLTPWSQVHTVSANDVVGPIVIDEAYHSGQPLIPVMDTASHPKKVVGMLRVSQLGIESTGMAVDAMDKKVYYLHEEDSLAEALHAFYVTNQPMFIVIDSRQHHTGVIMIGSLLRQLLGDLPGQQADSYADYELAVRRHRAPKVEPETTEEEKIDAVDDSPRETTRNI